MNGSKVKDGWSKYSSTKLTHHRSHQWFSWGVNLIRPILISSRLPNIPLFELSRSQIIHLICAFISPKLQLAGYLVEIIIPRYLGLVCKISRYLSSASSPARRLALCANAEQNFSTWFLELELQVSRSNLELMRTRFVTSVLFPKSEIAGYLAIWRWWRQAYWFSMMMRWSYYSGLLEAMIQD